VLAKLQAAYTTEVRAAAPYDRSVLPREGSRLVQRSFSSSLQLATTPRSDLTCPTGAAGGIDP